MPSNVLSHFGSLFYSGHEILSVFAWNMYVYISWSVCILTWVVLAWYRLCRNLLPYILAYKPTILDWIVTLKLLLGSAYTRVVPHSHTLTAGVSTASTISSVCMGACTAGSGTTHIYCCSCIPVKSSTVTWHW